MAEITERVTENVPGRYYVDASCIYCDLCVEIAPTVFKEQKVQGWAFVARQPETQEEDQAAIDAVEACPTGSIGADGDQYDWKTTPRYRNS